MTSDHTRVKICCIASVEEAEMALTQGADALGFVADMPSGPGVIDDAAIASVIGAIPGSTDTFLLTSRSAPDDVVSHIHICNPSTVQLVDAVPVETYAAIRAQTSHIKIVQVIHVQGPEAVEEATSVAEYVDAVLLDSGNTSGEVKQLGGTGRTHDWSVSRAIVDTLEVPVWLAGGLNAENVSEAITQIKPHGLDLCTGVRTVKKLDEEKLKAFMKAVRNS